MISGRIKYVIGGWFCVAMCKIFPHLHHVRDGRGQRKIFDGDIQLDRVVWANLKTGEYCHFDNPPKLNEDRTDVLRHTALARSKLRIEFGDA